MKTILLIGLTILLSLITISYCSPQKYTSKYDNINIDEILHNERLLKNYVACLLEKGPCTAQGKELKAHLKEGLETDCLKCTDKQRELGRKIIGYLRENKPQIWEEVEKKYDPQGLYKKRHSGQ